jgi:metal-responsive CopG/Arc/MetJ family transcriptional regulator
MKTIRVVLDPKLLNLADLAAKRQKVSRSELIRQALHHNLTNILNQDLEEQDRRGYLRQPQRPEDFKIWENAAAWPQP